MDSVPIDEDTILLATAVPCDTDLNRCIVTENEWIFESKTFDKISLVDECRNFGSIVNIRVEY